MQKNPSQMEKNKTNKEKNPTINPNKQKTKTPSKTNQPNKKTHKEQQQNMKLGNACSLDCSVFMKLFYLDKVIASLFFLSIKN